ncbi:MAG: peptidoglycan-associated lipoprotein Pal [Rickettsiales bacterium]|jgi:peptidoglycan-associated lipoprotein|nr:peptidoglycan-associated lipoprotein Pal [Rickettsiales bacterium]MCA0254773.1 peptidoglycan-associated lipoprotein Pal [Pseudomonadota bacterium]
MLKKIAVAFIAVVMLSGCSASKGKYGDSRLISEFEKNVGDRVFFKLDSSEISSESQATLSRQAAWLKDHKLFSLTAEGHCDERGTREYNIALGERRANAVKDFLVGHGISAERIETISYGKERPAVIGDNEEAWSQNRRGVTVLK